MVFGAEKLRDRKRLLQNGTLFSYDQPFQGNIDAGKEIWKSAR